LQQYFRPRRRPCRRPFAGVLDAARIPGAATAITLVAVVALLSALNANLYGASRMVFSLAERGEAPGFLSRLSRAGVPIVAVGVSVAFGFIATVLELLFPERILPALFQLVGSTCLVVWGSALVSQFILRRRADRDGTPLPLRMKGFPGSPCSASCCSGWCSPWASAQRAAASS
jgi:AAT family amino acid transporter